MFNNGRECLAQGSCHGSGNREGILPFDRENFDPLRDGQAQPPPQGEHFPHPEKMR